MARIRVRLTPRGSRDAIDGWSHGVLRVRVAATPIAGKANDALLRLLAKTLGLPASRVTLTSGTTSRVKTIEVDGMTPDEVRLALDP